MRIQRGGSWSRGPAKNCRGEVATVQGTDRTKQGQDALLVLMRTSCYLLSAKTPLKQIVSICRNAIVAVKPTDQHVQYPHANHIALEVKQ